MRLRDYIKDNMAEYALSITSLVVILIFLNAYKVKAQAVYVVAGLFIITLILVIFLGYRRKKAFIDRGNHKRK
ncbi:MAG: hypothetical protein K6E46_01170 [Lachnospiraceae bacterium]|nr:hypothetical protein [Lachnospiraceae bacterium]